MVGFNLLLDSGLHFAEDTEAPAVRDVDDAAPLVAAEGRRRQLELVAWMPREQQERLLWLCHATRSCSWHQGG